MKGGLAKVRDAWGSQEWVDYPWWEATRKKDVGRITGYSDYIS